MKEIGQCKDCQLWQSIEEEEPGAGICTALDTISTRPPFNLCRGYGKGSSVIVGELFGCILFEARG